MTADRLLTLAVAVALTIVVVFDPTANLSYGLLKFNVWTVWVGIMITALIIAVLIRESVR